MGAMRKVHTSHVHARFNHSGQGFFVGAGRTKGADNFSVLHYEISLLSKFYKACNN
jgi:hypothetical protein